jgi:hypothetical protein
MSVAYVQRAYFTSENIYTKILEILLNKETRNV